VRDDGPFNEEQPIIDYLESSIYDDEPSLDDFDDDFDDED
jgi:hypothetical protein